jgi:hypothetical protein
MQTLPRAPSKPPPPPPPPLHPLLFAPPLPPAPTSMNEEAAPADGDDNVRTRACVRPLLHMPIHLRLPPGPSSPWQLQPCGRRPQPPARAVEPCARLRQPRQVPPPPPRPILPHTRVTFHRAAKSTLHHFICLPSPLPPPPIPPGCCFRPLWVWCSGLQLVLSSRRSTPASRHAAATHRPPLPSCSRCRLSAPSRSSATCSSTCSR